MLPLYSIDRAAFAHMTHPYRNSWDGCTWLCRGDGGNPLAGADQSGSDMDFRDEILGSGDHTWLGDGNGGGIESRCNGDGDGVPGNLTPTGDGDGVGD